MADGSGSARPREDDASPELLSSETHRITADATVTRVTRIPSTPAADHGGEAMVAPWLVVVGGNRIGEAVRLEVGQKIIVGRDESLPIVLSDKSVSPRHAEFTVTALDEATVCDLGSANGTYVNGQRVAMTTVRPCDRVQLGSTAVLRITLRDISELPHAPAKTRAADDSPTDTTKRLPDPTEYNGCGPLVVGSSSALLATMGLAEQVAKTESSVLIVGETGTGKELVARAIHAASARCKGPFVAVDLSAIAPTLIEGALFGHVKGAYTGADRSSAGIIETARGGTLFLDEIGEPSLQVQAKLLRVLQERTYVQLGGTAPLHADFRLICATLRDLEKEVHEKRFREDLLYRIDVVRIEIPPLRDRMSDIEPLARSFLARYCCRDGRDLLSLSQEALDELCAYHWPGNVRELQHTVERAVALTPDGQPVRGGLVNWRKKRSSMEAIVDADYNQNRGLDEILAEVERRILADAMTRFDGNQTAVAAKLKLPRSTLRNKLKRFDLG